MMECASEFGDPLLDHSSTPLLQFLSFPQRLFQRSILPERFRPADVLFEVGAGFDEVEDDVVDAFVGHGGADLNMLA